MRCRCVGANVSPMIYDVSPATVLIKPALLSYWMKQKHGPSGCQQGRAAALPFAAG